LYDPAIALDLLYRSPVGQQLQDPYRPSPRPTRIPLHDDEVRHSLPHLRGVDDRPLGRTFRVERPRRSDQSISIPHLAVDVFIDHGDLPAVAGQEDAEAGAVVQPGSYRNPRQPAVTVAVGGLEQVAHAVPSIVFDEPAPSLPHAHGIGPVR